MSALVSGCTVTYLNITYLDAYKCKYNLFSYPTPLVQLVGPKKNSTTLYIWACTTGAGEMHPWAVAGTLTSEVDQLGESVKRLHMGVIEVYS